MERPRFRLGSFFFLVVSSSVASALKAWDSDPEKLLVAQVNIKADVFHFGVTAPQEQLDKKPQEAAGSGPARRAKVKAFAIDKTAVTNDQFRRFVDATKYVTEAETFKWSFVHELLASKKTLAYADRKGGMGRVKESPHWVGVEGASWRHPFGNDSSLDGLNNHPVVHVSYNDAKAYCKWANGRRLPTEKEWEYAARGGHDEEPFPWGGDESSRVNSWQGKFPKQNTEEDGWVGPAPVEEYDAPNAYGLHNLLGNVWEWCEGGSDKARPLRGGSYVDTMDGSFNHVLRVWTRMENSADAGSDNIGFRCASGQNNNAEEPPKIGDKVKKKQMTPKDLDQNELQSKLAEGGAEGVQDWLRDLGIGGDVMTAAQLREARTELKEQQKHAEKKLRREL